MAPLAEQHYRALFMQSPVGIVVSELDGTILEINEAACALRGAAEGQLVGTNSLEWVDRSHWADASANVTALMFRNVERVHVERRYNKGDGTFVWVESVTEVIKGSDGTPRYLLSFVADISQRKAAEDARRWLIDIVESSQDCIVAIDLDGTIQSWNQGAERVFGYTAAEMIGRRGGFLAPNGTDIDREQIVKRILDGEHVECRIVAVRQDGRRVTLLTNFTAIRDSFDKVTGIATISRDLTSEEQAQIMFKSLLEAAPDAIVCLDERGLITLANAKTELLFGYAGSELIGQPIGRLLPESAGTIEQALQGHGTDHQPERRAAARFEQNGRKENGHEFPAEITASSIPTEAGLLLTLAIRDGTERRQAAIVASLGDAIVGVALNGTITSWNGAAKRIFGFTVEEAIGQNINELIIPPDLTDETASLFQRVRQGLPVEAHETKRIRSDGSIIDVSVTLSPICDSSGATVGISAVVRDITEAKHLEERLRQSERLESLGHLAGGVAHDFNNLLTVIMSSAEFLRDAVDGEARRDLEAIESAGERAAALTRQLLTFARQDAVSPEPVSINQIVTEVEKLLRRTLGEHVELQSRLADDIWLTVADPSQIEQVLINLAVNARDAMPGGGKLTIDTANVDIDHEYAAGFPTLLPGRYVRIRVSDSGSGMDETTKRHAFEPFFTTKERGKGTGLGLATVHGIVSQAGGAVQIYSEVGTGTTVSALWPAIMAGLTETAAPSQIDAMGGSETLLVVDDEEDIRDIAQRILGSKGYHVLVARSGDEALALSASYQNPIDLVLTDVIMPNMGGGELVRLLTAERPTTKAIFMSGYAGDFLQLNERPGDMLLEKPFTGHSLLTKVRRALDD
jgi:hypothetical protein